jgi:hypothetical protein
MTVLRFIYMKELGNARWVEDLDSAHALDCFLGSTWSKYAYPAKHYSTPLLCSQSLLELSLVLGVANRWQVLSCTKKCIEEILSLPPGEKLI